MNQDSFIPGADAGPWPGDVEVPGGTFQLGAPEDGGGFVFDNEKSAHPVTVAPFAIARAPVTNTEYAHYLDATGAAAPVYWRRGEHGGWLVRRYDRLVPLPPHQPVIHVSWYEADAYCRWAHRRLPTEAEWELAAATPDKRTFPWGDAPPSPAHANLDARAAGPVDVAACPTGDSLYGCRQLIGNVWEWTATRFAPYPGFVVDPYAEYSAPWFATPHMVLRGGCWATRGRLLRNTWRNFYPPDRSDVLAGFRTCAAP
jgi:gamma-glutamyl hercynylcysteine S-oxide synthase